MPDTLPLQIGLLKKTEVDEAHRIMKLAFGTFLGLPDPMAFMGDRNFILPRSRARNTRLIAARQNGRLIGLNVLTRWGSFGFFGPLVVLPEFWGKQVAQRLLEETTRTFDRWGVRHSGLFTFAHSSKHVGLYIKAGYWPRNLTALMSRKFDGPAEPLPAEPTLLTALPRAERQEIIAACRRLTNSIDRGLDLTGEIESILRQRTGDVILVQNRSRLDAFALCATGPGSEGGEQTGYLKFAAARPGPEAGHHFDRLLAACDAFARPRGLTLEAGCNMAREDAFRRMRAHGYRPMTQGIAMHRPNLPGFNREDAYVIDDWR
ncbi:MAG: GNAT family N-acetyltransferase [Acidobacteriaceae bacterium]|jgi:GNAT superfamily N-acetyltransferase